MVGKFKTDNVGEIIILELSKDGCRCAPLDEGVIDSVRKVGRQTDGVDGNEQDMQEGLPAAPFLDVQWEEE